MTAVVDTTTERFERDVLEASRQIPVVVDFWAPWCGPCRVVGPVLEKLAAQAAGRWRLVKLNTEAEPGVAAQFRIQSIPALKIFADGQVVAETVGALPEPQLEAWIEQAIPSEATQALTEARERRSAGDAEGARAAFETALAAEPSHRDVRAEFAELLFFADRARALNLIEGLDDDLEVGERVASLRWLAELPGRLESNDDGTGWARYRDGIRHLLDGEFEPAIDALLEVVRTARRVDDDGARRTCIALFTVLGDAHPLTQSARPKLASAMF